MSVCTLIIGESGTGKSTSIKNLDENETFIINVLNKPLPFKGFNKRYSNFVKDSEGNWTGNYYASDLSENIEKVINIINKSLPKIKNIIIDDYQYIMGNEFMRRATEKSYDKFSEIGKNAWSIINFSTKCRDDLFFFFLSHSETDANGRAKCKTIGKMLDEKITIEGMFTTVLHSLVEDKEYNFLTQNDGKHIAKSPMGMFSNVLVPNDLAIIRKTIYDYYFGD